MKWIVLVVALMAMVVSPVLAADMVTLKAKNGDVTFNHKVHGEKADCKICHGEGTPGKLSLGGKDPAHKLCTGCHTEKKAGPVLNKCMDCHKKK